MADPWHITWVDETGSTNADLLAAGTAGAPGRTVLAARYQTAGRGRLDRRWDTPAGANLLVSILLRDVPPHAHEVTQRVALAALAASRAMTGAEPTLKWPNDLLLDGSKLAGVLAQTGTTDTGSSGSGTSDSGTSDSGAFVVVGIGINVGWAPPGAARLGDGVTPTAVLDAMLAAYDELPADIGPTYREHLGTIGQQVRVELPGERFVEGRAIGVEPDGRLVVLDDCAITHRIDTGDVVHLRPA